VYAADNLFGVNFTVPGYLAVGNDLIVRLTDNRQLSLKQMRRAVFSPDGSQALGERESRTLLRDLLNDAEREVSGLFFVDGQWVGDRAFIVKVGAYGSVIGQGTIDGPFTDLVEDAGNGPFVGVLR
jgi:hypothetical protein